MKKRCHLGRRNDAKDRDYANTAKRDDAKLPARAPVQSARTDLSLAQPQAGQIQQLPSEWVEWPLIARWVTAKYQGTTDLNGDLRRNCQSHKCPGLSNSQVQSQRHGPDEENV
jgi:hypothetical protein